VPIPSLYVEAAEPFRLFVHYLHAFDRRPTRTLVHEANEPVDGVRLAFEYGFDSTVPSVGHRTGHSALLSEATHRIPEEHSLHTSV
jgi:hypothetical protein